MTNNFFVNRLDLGTTWRPTSEDAETFVRDYVAAWVKVMDLDRFDLA